jgi:hypothetical protein
LEADHTDRSLDESESPSKRKHQKALLEEHGAWLLALVAGKSDLSLRDVQTLLSREEVISVGPLGIKKRGAAPLWQTFLAEAAAVAHA